MGLVFSSILSRLYSKQNVRILMVGLDAAGKTTILYQLKLGDVVHTIPTIGFNVETVDYKNISFTVYDVGGQEVLRPLWRHYYTNTKGLIYVIDSLDVERLPEAVDEFERMLSHDEIGNASVLILANKQDLPNAMTPAEIGEKLGLYKMRGRQWHIQGTCAITSEGIVEGLDWLSKNMPKE